jgi:hypothetical protein
MMSEFEIRVGQNNIYVSPATMTKRRMEEVVNGSGWVSLSLSAMQELDEVIDN